MQLFSGKRTANVVPGTPLHVNITSPNDLRYFKGPYSLKLQKNQKPTMTLNKYSKQKDTIDRLDPCFCHKISFIMYGSTYAISPALSPSQTVCTHINIRANVSATLTILSVTV